MSRRKHWSDGMPPEKVYLRIMAISFFGMACFGLVGWIGKLLFPILGVVATMGAYTGFSLLIYYAVYCYSKKRRQE